VRNGIVQIVCICCLAVPASGLAQTISPVGPQASQLPAPSAASFWAPFAEVPKDIVNFFSADTARILGVATAGAMVAHRWDDDGIAMALGRFQPVANFHAGNVGGGLYAQLGGAFAVYSFGKATRFKPVAELGGELVRAQILSQAFVQAMKFSFQRSRPDGSNRLSLPSGHTAGAVATATVLQRRYGWKVGLPAYTASAYVAASRMSANKHHLTDVMIGAAIGLSAGRTVTVGTEKNRFAVGLAPTVGGAAVTFTKK
jgi:membrane-associated phospholipid phosphatase